MDFIDRIKEISKRIPSQIDYCKTEEATKNAMIMPFINALGYDVFNPMEVMPEFTADIGVKKGEKVDYAIMKDNHPIIFFECKWAGADLSKEHASQLHRYFATIPDVRFGVLTNGIVYNFYSDLDTPNVMDDKPFFVFNILDFQDRQIEELKKFTKSTFDLDDILTTASELKYMAAMRKFIASEFENPSDDFVRFLAKQVYSGVLTQSVREKFAIISKKALKRFLNDKISERLKSALDVSDMPITEVKNNTVDEIENEEDEEENKQNEIVTTDDEIEGFFVIKSILRDTINVKRIHMRDAKSYCSILFDDNNRKPICRLYFNRTQKYIGLFDGENKNDRVPIEEIDDMYNLAERIINTVKKYME